MSDATLSTSFDIPEMVAKSAAAGSASKGPTRST
jgi:hypothetical protein